MDSRIVACIVNCLLATSTIVSANARLGDDAALANPLADVPAPGLKPVNIPNDVADGMLIYKINPEYPAKAKKGHISGIVILKARISQAGEISDLRAQCGPEILVEPSLKAVREWKYRPYLLKGKPVEVDTTIKVVFALGGKKKLPFSKDSCPAE